MTTTNGNNPDPSTLSTALVVERFYDYLLRLKAARVTRCYSECCEPLFGIAYEPPLCKFIQERRTVVNNIPCLLGGIGHVCNALDLPPLCCLIVNKMSRECGGDVVTSRPVERAKRAAFARDVDRPAVYQCDDYPRPGTPEAGDFVERVLRDLRENYGWP